MKNLLLIFGLVFFSQSIVADSGDASKKSELSNNYSSCSMNKSQSTKAQSDKKEAYQKTYDQTLNSVIRTSSY